MHIKFYNLRLPFNRCRGVTTLSKKYLRPLKKKINTNNIYSYKYPVNQIGTHKQSLT